MTVTADTGEYLVRAGMRSLNGTVPYTLVATTTFRRIGLGETRTSILSRADYDNKDGWYYEAWAYRGSAGQRITLNVRSTVPAETPVYLALSRPENGRMVQYAGVHAGGQAFPVGGMVSKEAVLPVYIADDREYQILIYSKRAVQSRYTLSVATTPPVYRFVP